MFEAQLLITKSAPYSVLSPWLGRGGDILRATIQLINAAASGTKITVDVMNKAAEDAGSGTVVGSSINTTGAGAGTPVVGEWSGVLKGLVRYKFPIEGTSGTTTGR